MKRWVNGEETELDPNFAEVNLSGDRLMVRTAEGAYSALAVRDGDRIRVSYRGRQYLVEERPKRVSLPNAEVSGELRSPMPGQIVDIRVALGANVVLGATILVVEAMKTQQPLLAPFDGTLSSLNATLGQSVTEGAVLAVVTRSPEN